MKLDLKGLTESFKIRDTETDNLDEYCFARLLISHLMSYFKTTTLAGLMPFDFENLFCTKNVVFINVDQFAQASEDQNGVQHHTQQARTYCTPAQKDAGYDNKSCCKQTSESQGKALQIQEQDYDP